MTPPTPLEHIRHTLAHLLASAVLERFPEAKLAIGPTIETGFYYDFDIGRPFTQEDLPPLEKRMRQLIKKNLAMVKVDIDSPAVQAYLERQPMKRELMAEIQDRNEPVSFYQIGNFIDLCRGGHVGNSREIPTEAFTLTHAAGAYWRGDSNKPMLQRIYGAAFGTKAELDAYRQQLDEAAKRDHRKLGKDLELYSFDAVAPGAVFWHPHGMIIWNELERLLRETLTPAGYQEVQTPLMVKPELFLRSGHLKHYKDNMFRVEGHDEEFYLKPMNCPESAVIYAAKPRSYRDLPLRLAEIGRIHRNELSGTLGGLFRVRQITQDDGHLYCTMDQLQAEITHVLKLSKQIYATFGLTPSFYLSTKPDNAMGDPKRWTQAESALVKALRANHLPFKEKPKDGTFYAPKIDVDITDSLGRRWQLCTIQADLVMVPSLPGVEYVDDHGEMQQPVVIHRAIFGSFERFIGILVEHYAGQFPLWLSPVQVQIIPVTTKHNASGKKLAKLLAAAGIRVHLDDANETVGYKIRKAEKQKTPYMVVIGDREKSLTALTIRVHGKKAVRHVTLKRWIPELTAKISKRSATL